jgi:hypothetical protein
VATTLRVARADFEGVPFHGFADAGWGYGSEGMPSRELTKGFALGTMDIYLNPQFSNNVKSLMEIAFEPNMDALEVGVDVERLLVGYTFSDALTVWVGRYHTPYGYWNTAYHHGAQIQPSVYKPRFIDWEDNAGFMPSHSVGTWLTGHKKLGKGKISYDLWLSNGSRNTAGFLDMNILKDDNTSIAVGGRLFYRFGGAISGFILGLHGLSEEVDTYDSNNSNLYQNRLNMVGGFAVYEEKNFEFSAEFYNFMNTNLGVTSSPTISSAAGFVHLGYSIFQDLVPYGRIEKAGINQADTYFNTLQNGFSYLRGVFGIRYNLSARACIKVEGHRTIISDTTSFVTAATYNELRTQYAVSF